MLQLHDRLQGQVLVAEIRNTDTLLNLFVPLLKALSREPKRSKEAKALVERLRSVNTFRNDLLHGPWGAYFAEDGQFQKLNKKSSSATVKAYHFTVAEIENQTCEVMQVQGDLKKFVQDVLNEHRAKRGYTLWHDELP